MTDDVKFWCVLASVKLGVWALLIISEVWL